MNVNHVGDVNIESSVVPIRPVYLFAGEILGKLRPKHSRTYLCIEIYGGPVADDLVLLA